MKSNTRTLIRFVMMLALLFTTAACDKNDDINAIFRGQTWYVTYVKDGNITLYPQKDKFYAIEFKNDKFTAYMPNGSTISGHWYADGGGSHTFYCRNVEWDSKIWGDSISEKMLDIFNNAQSYEGDTNWLQIIQNKNTYMQFYNKKR